MACGKLNIEQRLADIVTDLEKLRFDEIEKSLTSEKTILEVECKIKCLERELESNKERNKRLKRMHEYDTKANSVVTEILQNCPRCKADNLVRINKIFEICIYTICYMLLLFTVLLQG